MTTKTTSTKIQLTKLKFLKTFKNKLQNECKTPKEIRPGEVNGWKTWDVRLAALKL